VLLFKIISPKNPPKTSLNHPSSRYSALKNGRDYRQKSIHSGEVANLFINLIIKIKIYSVWFMSSRLVDHKLPQILDSCIHLRLFPAEIVVTWIFCKMWRHDENVNFDHPITPAPQPRQSLNPIWTLHYLYYLPRITRRWLVRIFLRSNFSLFQQYLYYWPQITCRWLVRIFLGSNFPLLCFINPIGQNRAAYLIGQIK
jgi:hypothetical protein